MTASSRQSLLLIFVPALLLGLIMFGYFRPTRAWSQLRLGLAERKANGATELAVKAVSEKRAAQEQKLQDLVQQRTGLVDRWLRLRDGADRPLPQHDLVDTLAAVLREHDLKVIANEASETTNVPGGDSMRVVADRLSQPVETTFPLLRNANPAKGESEAIVQPAAPKRIIWEVTVAGTYRDVEAALRALAAANAKLAPLTIEMDLARPELSLRRWTFTFIF